MARWISEAKQKVLIEKSNKLLLFPKRARYNESCNLKLFNPSADLSVSDLRKVKIKARGQYLQKQFEREREKK